MNDQNNAVMNDLLPGLSDEQKNEFQKLATETLASRLLERIISTMTDEEIEEMKALPENDPAAVEVYINSKYSKEELEQMAREELEMIKERMMAAVQSTNDDVQMELDAQQVMDESPIDESIGVDGPTS